MKSLLQKITPIKALYCIVIAVPILFNNAFTMHYFGDDFAFLKASRAESWQDIAAFFNPFRETFYRPLSSELFYYLHHLSNYNLVFFHAIVFVTFIIGVIWLYKLLLHIHLKKWFAVLVVFMYAIHFTHVYQLYWFATFQEVLMFAGIIGALLYGIKNKWKISLTLFIVSLLSKETALLFTPLLVVCLYVSMNINKHNLLKPSVKKVVNHFNTYKTLLILSIGLTICALVVYSWGLSETSRLPQYAIRFSPRLFVDNAYWFWLWSFGFPSFLPDYMSRMISLPHKEFWNNFVQPYSLVYVYSLIGYIISLVIGFVIGIYKRQTRATILVTAIISFAVFFITLLPSLLISHKWMVRLTVPIISSLIFQGYVLYVLLSDSHRAVRIVGVFGIVMYILMNLGGIPVHEISSTYALENTITTRAHDIFATIDVDKNSRTAVDLFFVDNEEVTISSWEGSEKLRTSLSNQNFIDYYFGPDAKNITAYYDYESSPSANAIKIQSRAFFR